jgi:hypothetical protein
MIQYRTDRLVPVREDQDPERRSLKRREPKAKARFPVGGRVWRMMAKRSRRRRGGGGGVGRRLTEGQLPGCVDVERREKREEPDLTECKPKSQGLVVTGRHPGAKAAGDR